MKGDFTRSTFDRTKRYSGVRMQQGRVQLDADWNENLDILRDRTETETVDVVGRCGVPVHSAGFGVEWKSLKTGVNFNLTNGRIYVDGILVENDGTGIDENGVPTKPKKTGVSFRRQPFRVRPESVEISEKGFYGLYLDVWERHITAVEDPGIREVALGGPDTATRTQVVWQAVLCKVNEPTCAAIPIPEKSTGKLAARTKPEVKPETPCYVAPQAGYRRLENQLYRVEIHTSTDPKEGATFKWSRDNGSVAVAIKEFKVNGADNKIRVADLGRDDVLGLQRLDWVEVLDDAHELTGQPGDLVRIDDIGPDNTLTLSQNVTAYNLNLHPKVRRWDSKGALEVVISTDNDIYIPLEGGIEIKFTPGDLRTGDYWQIPARTVPGEHGDIEWPTEEDVPEELSPFGIKHHYCPLAVITATEEKEAVSISSVRECRMSFPPLTELPSGGASCCSVSVGEGGDCKTLEEALAARPPGTDIWHICILPGTLQLSAPIVIDKGHSGLIISGCEWQSKIIAESNHLMFIIDGCSTLRLESLMIETHSPAGAIYVRNSSDVHIVGCEICNVISDPQSKIPLPALLIHAYDCSDVEIADNTLRGAPAIFAYGERLRIAHNHITGGGIRIIGGSADVTIDGNVIRNGTGAGIQLGIKISQWDPIPLPHPPIPHPIPNPKSEPPLTRSTGPVPSTSGLAPATTIPETGPTDFKTSGIRFEPEKLKTKSSAIYVDISGDETSDEIPEEPITTSGVIIKDNLIRAMEGSGIISGTDLTNQAAICDVTSLAIMDNRIIECALKPDMTLATDMFAGGGIVLMAVSSVSITENLIAHNGGGVVPSCGILIIDGSNITIEHNRIFNNGLDSVPPKPALYQAGVAVLLVFAPDSAFTLTDSSGLLSGIPGIRIHGNEIATPAGQALNILSMGMVSVLGNTFSSGPAVAPPPFLNDWGELMYFAACVSIFNFGFPVATSYVPVNSKTTMHYYGMAAMEQPQPAVVIPDGRILFNDNQVSFKAGDTGNYKYTNPSAFLYSLGDISMCGNQIQSTNMIRLMLSDVFAHGTTIRASGNYFCEPRGLSLFSFVSGSSIMNTIVGNQAIHNIYTDDLHAVNEHNSELITR